MQKYEENLAANTSGALRPLAGASVTATDQVTGLPAFLYSDNGVTPLAQPLTTDNDGYIGFYAADGKYTLTFTSPRFAQFTRSIVLEDPDDNPFATLGQLAASTGASLIRHDDKVVSQVLDELTQDFSGITQKVDDLEQAIEGIGPGGDYTLPTASATVLGGIKLGANLTADAEGVVKAGVSNGAIVSTLASTATAPRTYTFPDKTMTLADAADIAITKYVQTADQVMITNSLLTIAHGLGKSPIILEAYIKCIIADAGYPVGAAISSPFSFSNTLGNAPIAVFSDDTNIYARTPAIFRLTDYASGTVVGGTINNWRIFFRAYA